MKRLISRFAVAATALAAVAPTTGARADDGGRVAAGIAGGFLGGMLLGGALAPRPVYPPPPPTPPYGPPPPGYVDYGPGPDGPPPPATLLLDPRSGGLGRRLRRLAPPARPSLRLSAALSAPRSPAARRRSTISRSAGHFMR